MGERVEGSFITAFSFTQVHYDTKMTWRNNDYSKELEEWLVKHTEGKFAFSTFGVGFELESDAVIFTLYKT
jgi:hypothetical protein